LGEHLPDIVFEEVRIHSANDGPAHALLYPPFPFELVKQNGPEIIVFPHAVIEPADMGTMADGIAGKPEGNDVVDGTTQSVHSHIRQGGGQVGPELTAEAVLRSRDEIRLVAGFMKSPDQGAGDGQMAAFHKGNIGGDDADSHGC